MTAKKKRGKIKKSELNRIDLIIKEQNRERQNKQNRKEQNEDKWNILQIKSRKNIEVDVVVKKIRLAIELGFKEEKR